MDQYDKRNIDMAKMMVYLFCCTLLCKTAVAITNLAQIVGCTIDAMMVQELPRRDFTTPETAYLNFIRALVTTNEADWVAGFSSQKMIEYVGSDNPDSLSNRNDSPLVEILTEHMVSNMTVTSYIMEHISTNRVRINADIACSFGNALLTNSFPIVFSRTNDTWVIVDFLEDE
jgi:hypothetical protein